MVRPERFELPTPWFEAKYSIQLSYGRPRIVKTYHYLVAQGIYCAHMTRHNQKQGLAPIP